MKINLEKNQIDLILKILTKYRSENDKEQNILFLTYHSLNAQSVGNSRVEETENIFKKFSKKG